MTRFIVDPSAVIHLAGERLAVAAGHELLAPTMLRSQVLLMLHEAIRRGEIPADIGRERLAQTGQIKMRYLGDAVLRRRAWDLGQQHGWASTYPAEYVALTQLQGDALVTLDPDLARLAEGIVERASIEEVTAVRAR